MPTLHAYAHTHWDREWYQPFESFRLQLVAVVEKVLDELESGRLPYFYLDGQAIIFEDVLAIKPELRSRLEAAIRSGKLAAGPWYVLADEMLVGGESLIRNLSLGLSITSSFGAPAMIGYSPDTFGHSQDLPRILNGFGIRNAVLWRGVPLLEMGPAFWWSGAGGGRVLAYHLKHGYYQTALNEIPQGDFERKKEAVAQVAEQLKLLFGDGRAGGAGAYEPQPFNGALLPVGGDHVSPPANFHTLLQEINLQLKEATDLEIVATSLPVFLDSLQDYEEKNEHVVQAVDGELRFNRAASKYERAYLLYGVLSTRLYLKRANCLAERKLKSLCEPLFAMIAALGIGRYPEAALDHAWKLLLQNHPHDSICGCSVDAVHRQMQTRFEQLNDVLDCLLSKAASLVSGAIEGAAPASGDPSLACNQLAIFNTSLLQAEAPVYLKWYENIDSQASYPTASVQIEKRTRLDCLFSGWGQAPYYKEVEQIEGWVWAGSVDGLGTKCIAWPPVTAEDAPQVTVRSGHISNGLLAVSISRAGQISVSHMVSGKAPCSYNIGHKFRDVGDGGDSYNFDPLVDDSPVRAMVVSLTAGKTGPLVGSIFIEYEIDLPERAVASRNPLKGKGSALGKIQVMKRSGKRVKHRIITEVLLKRGVPIVFFETTFENRSSDHRLEIVFDTGAPVTSTLAENHFSLVKRHHAALPKEKLPVKLGHEAVPERFPCQRFFIANGQVFFNSGLPEYGINGAEVAMTLVRAVSWLSRGQLWTRGGGAGPSLAVPGANCFGQNVVNYGYAPLPTPKDDAGPLPESQREAFASAAYHLVEQYEGSLWSALTKDDRIPTSSFLQIDNDAIVVVAMFIKERRLYVRFLNTTLRVQAVRMLVKAACLGVAWEVALDRSPIAQLEMQGGAFSLNFAANQLATVCFALHV